MSKPELEFHVPTSDWEAAGVEGMSQLVLSLDEETGDYARLARLEPGTTTIDLGTFTHEFQEEVYIVHGDLTDLRLDQTFHGGMYACRPPGMPHGPYATRNGCLMVEIRYGFRGDD